MTDILIRGMEMPKDCPFCPMAHWNKFDALTGCNVVPGKKFVPETESEYWYSDHRPSWCPLVPLPEGHGRLGDLGALEAKFREEALQHTFTGDLNRMTLGMGEAIDRIKAAPTIISAEGGNADGN